MLRIEDLDPPREIKGASDQIISTLDALGFEWDEAISYQSQQYDHYELALNQLKKQDLLYPCACTRKEIADSGIQGIEGAVYPGTCRAGIPAGRSPRAWRVKVDTEIIHFNDLLQGEITQYIKRDIGDFVLKRADGFYAYQLAVVVDDARQGITHIVRGADLLDSTPRQLHLQSLLAYSNPQYLHLPIAVNNKGEKLSKQTLAAPIQTAEPSKPLWDALRFLGQAIPEDLRLSTTADVWDWAFTHWNAAIIPRTTKLDIT